MTEPASVPPAPSSSPKQPRCTSTDTVGLRREKLRRRLANLQWLGAALGAGLTVFAAVKLGEGGAAEPPLLYLGPAYLTLAILSGTCVGYCFVKVQWQFDLLNRHLTTTNGGQYFGDEAPLYPNLRIPEAWEALRRLEPNLDDRDCGWPLREKLAYLCATLLAGAAAAILVAYLWAPAVVAWFWPKIETGTSKGGPLIPVDRVLLHATVFFESGRSSLSPDAERSLRASVKALRPFPNGCVLVEGHTDSNANVSYNLELGRLRGDRVQSILESEGVPLSAIIVSSFGESRPAASGNSQATHAQNRRVEISPAACVGPRAQ
jgi:peptidoglycan-associated lipoprotein